MKSWTKFLSGCALLLALFLAVNWTANARGLKVATDDRDVALMRAKTTDAETLAGFQLDHTASLVDSLRAKVDESKAAAADSARAVYAHGVERDQRLAYVAGALCLVFFGLAAAQSVKQ